MRDAERRLDGGLRTDSDDHSGLRLASTNGVLSRGRVPSGPMKPQRGQQPIGTRTGSDELGRAVDAVRPQWTYGFAVHLQVAMNQIGSQVTARFWYGFTWPITWRFAL
jgi:hypothetical protein